MFIDKLQNNNLHLNLTCNMYIVHIFIEINDTYGYAYM